MRIFTFTLLIIFFAVNSYSQPRTERLEFEAFDMRNGLSNNHINAILQDKIGYMWFGSENGLCRYDGYQFKTFRPTNNLSDGFISSEILHIREADDENFWVATASNLLKFDLQREVFETIFDNKDYQFTIKDILITRKGEFYLATTKGLYQLDTTTYELESINDDYLMTLYEDERGHIWIGSWAEGCSVLNPENSEITRYSEMGKYSNSNVTDFVQDNKGRMWITLWDNDAMIRLDEPYNPKSSKIKVFPVNEDVDGYLTTRVMYDVSFNEEREEIWVGTATGLAILSDLEDEKGFTVYDMNSNFMGQEAWYIYKDRENVTWVAVIGYGVRKVINKDVSFRNRPLLAFNGSDRGQHMVVTTLFEDDDNTIWIGLRTNLLLLWDRNHGVIKSIKEFDALNHIPTKANAVMSILKDREKGILWLATRYNGLYYSRIVDGEYTELKHLSGVVKTPEHIKCLVQGDNGKIWIASNDGLYQLAQRGHSEFIVNEVKEVNELIKGGLIINTLLLDDNGIWIGCRDSGLLFLSKDGGVTKYSSLNDESVISIFKDSENTLWVGTRGGGLNRLKENSTVFENFENIDIFSNNAIYSILEDNSSNLWMSSDRGVIKLNSLSVINTELFTTRDGIGNIQFNENSALLATKSNQLIFGGYKGLDCYDMNNAKDELGKSNVAISNILVNNISLKNLNEEDYDYISSSYLDELKLKYNQNQIEFNLVSLSYLAPENSRYAYKLSGIDNDWTYVSAEKRYVSYNNLPSGKYNFKFKSYNENCEWSEVESFNFVVRPALWLSLWAYLIYLAIGIFIIYIVIYVIQKRIELLNKINYEKVLNKKSEEVNRVKLEFFTNISHELFTPLSVMQCSIDDLRGGSNKNADKVSSGELDTLTVMELNLRRLKRLLQQIMEFRKAENGNLKLKVSQSDIVTFISRVCLDNFSSLLLRKKIKLNLKFSSDKIITYFDVDKVDKIMYNLLSNALKYNYENGFINVSVEEVESNSTRYVVLKVENSGAGIPQNRIQTIFQRFYEGDYRRFQTTGTGIGLSLTRDLVNLHNGEISVSSVVDETTSFTIKIPADRESYLEEQIDDAIKVESVNVDANVDDNAEAEISKGVDVEEGFEENTETEPSEETLNVLLVEDDTDLLVVMSRVLSKEFNVVVAPNGKEAVAVLEQNASIDLVITDYIMPVMDGVELVEYIRANERINHLPVIMLTAKTLTEHRLNGYQAGVDAYITKPVEMNILITRIRSIFKNRELLISKYRSKEDFDTSELNLSDENKEFLDKAISVIENNISNSEFSNDMFCQQMCMGNSTLYRKLKQITNMSANEFVRDVRIKKACILLQRLDLNVSDVAYMVGFTNPKYFSMTFKKVKNISPSAYIESLGREK